MSTRNATDRLRGFEVGQIVLRDRGLLEHNTRAAMSQALGVLNTASLALAVTGDTRKADALSETRGLASQPKPLAA